MSEYYVRVLFEGRAYILPCMDELHHPENLDYLEYFSYEFVKTHPDALAIEIYENGECIEILDPKKVMELDPCPHIGEYDGMRDPNIKEKIHKAIRKITKERERAENS